jgi:hypothetical protein
MKSSHVKFTFAVALLPAFVACGAPDAGENASDQTIGKYSASMSATHTIDFNFDVSREQAVTRVDNYSWGVHLDNVLACQASGAETDACADERASLCLQRSKTINFTTQLTATPYKDAPYTIGESPPFRAKVAMAGTTYSVACTSLERKTFLVPIADRSIEEAYGYISGKTIVTKVPSIDATVTLAVDPVVSAPIIKPQYDKLALDDRGQRGRWRYLFLTNRVTSRAMLPDLTSYNAGTIRAPDYKNYPTTEFANSRGGYGYGFTSRHAEYRLLVVAGDAAKDRDALAKANEFDADIVFFDGVAMDPRVGKKHDGRIMVEIRNVADTSTQDKRGTQIIPDTKAPEIEHLVGLASNLNESFELFNTVLIATSFGESYNAMVVGSNNRLFLMTPR